MHCKPLLRVLIALYLAVFVITKDANAAVKHQRLTKSQVAYKIRCTLLKSGGMLFRSRTGILYGMDSDTELSLKKDGIAVIKEYGYGLAAYEGIYHLNNDATLSFDFHNYKFPVVYLYKYRSSLYMTPVLSKQYILGKRGASLEMAGMKPFWPFKHIISRSRVGWAGGSIVCPRGQD